VRGELSHATITKVLHVPKMKNNFIFVSKLILEGFKVEFDKDGCKVNDAQGGFVVEARRDKNLYLLNMKLRKDMAHTKVSQLFEIVHTNVCGPMRTTSHGGA